MRAVRENFSGGFTRNWCKLRASANRSTHMACMEAQGAGTPHRMICSCSNCAPLMRRSHCLRQPCPRSRRTCSRHLTCQLATCRAALAASMRVRDLRCRTCARPELDVDLLLQCMHRYTRNVANIILLLAGRACACACARASRARARCLYAHARVRARTF